MTTIDLTIICETPDLADKITELVVAICNLAGAGVSHLSYDDTFYLERVKGLLDDDPNEFIETTPEDWGEEEDEGKIRDEW